MSSSRIWPAVLPKQIRDDRYRRAEVKVYDLLGEALDGSWTVFYSRPWLGITSTGAERDGECDFVIVHPKRGFLAVEVKGGGISFDPTTDSWTSHDRDGIRHSIKNPVDQARRAKHELLTRLRQQSDWPHHRFIRARHGVIFPDAERPPRNLGADRPRELFCCRPDLPRLGDWVRDRLSGGDSEELGRDGVKAFEKLLAAPFMLRVPLGHSLNDDDQAIASLTPQQFHILDAISELPRVAAGGGAGTGKTVLAMEDAVRLSETAGRTVLTCFGAPLARHLRTLLSGTEVEVLSFAELCLDFCRRAGVDGTSHFLDERSPDLLLKSVALVPTLRCEAVVVDEAQDFRSHWWIAIEGILADPTVSRLHAFYDTNQSVYGDLKGELAAFRLLPICLTRNLRNTKAIHSAASRFYQGLPMVADGPEGVTVQWLTCTADRLAITTEDAVRRLVGPEAVRPEDLAVLAADSETLDAIRSRLRKLPEEGLDCELVRDFKGLERQVVVLAATKDLADEPELAYVALSRPRAHLVVIGEPAILNWLQGTPTEAAALRRRMVPLQKGAAG